MSYYFPKMTKMALVLEDGPPLQEPLLQDYDGSTVNGGQHPPIHLMVLLQDPHRPPTHLRPCQPTMSTGKNIFFLMLQLSHLH